MRLLRQHSAAQVIVVVAVAAFVGAASAWWCWSRGYALYYGDAEAHLNIARRIVDSRTPGPGQIGTVWLPLPHLLMIPFVSVDRWWQNGVAGVVPAVTSFVVACGFLFAAARMIWGTGPAMAAVALFGLNPNMLYLQSTPMTEPVAAAGLAALLWATIRYRQAQSVGTMIAAAIASNALSLTRYEGWFLIPFVSLYLLWIAKEKWHAVAFGALAALGPLAWFAHNEFYYSDPLAFYRGPYSAMAIYRRQIESGMAPHPGNQDWIAAAQYFGYAVRHVIGSPLLVISAAGAVVAIWRRVWWPLAFLLLPGVFYIWSIHSGSTPVFVPELTPFTRYNTRYALVTLPLAAFASGGLLSLVSARFQSRLAVVLPAALSGFWFASAGPPSICWKESADGSEQRRAWTDDTALFLKENYGSGAGVIFSFGDLTGVFRKAGIPIHEGLYQDNTAAWDAAVARPDLFLREDWALALSGDPVARAARKAAYSLRWRWPEKGAAVVEIYRR